VISTLRRLPQEDRRERGVGDLGVLYLRVDDDPEGRIGGHDLGGADREHGRGERGNQRGKMSASQSRNLHEADGRDAHHSPVKQG